MKENLKIDKTQEIIDEYIQGDEFDEDGYGDLGFTLTENAIEKATKLPKEERKAIADILFPIK